MKKVHTVTDQGNPVAFYLDDGNVMVECGFSDGDFVAKSLDSMRAGAIWMSDGDTINAETMRGVRRALAKVQGGA